MELNSWLSVFLVGVFGNFAGAFWTYSEITKLPSGKWPDDLRIKKRRWWYFSQTFILIPLIGGVIAFLINGSKGVNAVTALYTGISWPVVLQKIARMPKKKMNK